MNMVALVDGQPRLLQPEAAARGLPARTAAKWSRAARVFELRKARERGHVLEGLAVALSNIDEFIALIKASPTPADGEGGADGAALALVAGRGDARSAPRPTPRGREGLPPEFGWHRHAGRRATGCPTCRRRRSSRCACSA